MHRHITNANKSINKSLFPNVLFFFVLVLANPLLALTGDIEEPINIESDTAEFNNNEGTANYTGNVIATQGTLKINATTIDILAPESELEKITSKGSPVKFEQKMDDGKMANGKAATMVYLVKEKKLILTGNAELKIEKDIVNNNHIEYFVDSGELHAGNRSTQKQGNRVKAIFHPANKNKEQPEENDKQ
jgi:lipopolysaccharide export system protein LptA